MKFDKRYKQLIYEWGHSEHWRTVIFQYAYDDMQLIPDSPLRFSVELKTVWNYLPGSAGSYDEPEEDGTFEFKDVLGIVDVTVYNEETNEIDDAVTDEDTFAEKYPEAYEKFVDECYDEPSEDVFNPYDHIDEMHEYNDYDYNYADNDH